MTEKNALKILDSTFRLLDRILAEEKEKRDRQVDSSLTVTAKQSCRGTEKAAAHREEMEEVGTAMTKHP